VSFPALAVACMATEQLPPIEWDEEFGIPDIGDSLDVEWVVYESTGLGRIMRVRSVQWL
jgi:hypothetical protein